MALYTVISADNCGEVRRGMRGRGRTRAVLWRMTLLPATASAVYAVSVFRIKRALATCLNISCAAVVV